MLRVARCPVTALAWAAVPADCSTTRGSSSGGGPAALALAAGGADGGVRLFGAPIAELSKALGGGGSGGSGFEKALKASLQLLRPLGVAIGPDRRGVVSLAAECRVAEGGAPPHPLMLLLNLESTLCLAPLCGCDVRGACKPTPIAVAMTYVCCGGSRATLATKGNRATDSVTFICIGELVVAAGKHAGMLALWQGRLAAKGGSLQLHPEGEPGTILTRITELLPGWLAQLIF